MSDLLNPAADISASELLLLLRERHVRLTVDGDRLSVAAPAGVLDAALQAAIRQNKLELVRLLLAESGDGPGVTPVDPMTPVRLASAQERLWLFQQMEPESMTYNLTPVLHIEGPLDVGRLERALTAVRQRHEPLHSVISEALPGGAIQPVSVEPDTLEIRDLSGLPEDARAAALHVHVQEQQHRPFDLRREVPLRSSLLRLDTERHALVTTFHHIGVDGVSLQYFYRDLAAFYDGAEPKPLRASYRQFADQDRRYWTGDRLEQRVAFWRETLAGAPAALDMPTDRPRGGSQSFTGSIVTRRLEGPGLAALRALAKSENATLFMAMLGALSAALHRHSGQRDIVIGTPLHGRDRSEFGNLVGMFVNQLPLRMKVAPARSLRDLLRDARQTVIGSMSEHEIPFGTLVESLEVPRDRSRTPIFQVMLNVLPPADVNEGIVAGDCLFKLPETRDLLAMFDGQSKFDLTLYVVQGAEEIHLALVYNSDLFARERMESLLDTLERILAAADQADLDIDKVLAPPTRVLTPPASPAPRPFLPEHHTVVERVAYWAQTTPDAPAVADAQRALTYRDLHQASGRVARSIATSSPDPRSPVGVMVRHDANIGVAIQGVLASGHPYIPLDPEYPDERLRFIAEDSGLALILTTEELSARARSLSLPGTSLITLEQAAAVDFVQPATPDPDSLAYMLYTSGSTGQPKAVLQTHRNLFTQAERYADALQVAANDRLGLLASISFDASLMDLFGGLLRGACVQALDARSIELDHLPDAALDAGLTTLHVTPTLFRSLARMPGTQGWPSIRAVVLGGEPMRGEDIEYFDASFPTGTILLNLYGASEHSFSLGRFVDRTSRSAEVSIGDPVGDVEVLLLDARGNEDGVAGEIAIRSAHNAIGYHDRPDLSARVFHPDPLHPGRTVYRTGDLARRCPDGSYVLVGRVDGQLKVRGHRVEPGDVESTLRRHPAVLDAGVHAPIGSDGERSLTACYVLRPGRSADSTELASWCGQHLPRYLVPTLWLSVEALPRTPSGKVDRNALPVADGGQIGGTGSRGELDAEEQAVLGVWCEILGVDEVDIHRDFFLVGGNSLSATQVVARLRDILEIEVPLRQFFDHPTIADTARWIRQNRVGAIPPPPLQPAGTFPDPMPLSSSQERMWMLKQLASDNAAYNMAAGSRVIGPLDVERFRASIAAVVRRQESLRTIFPVRDGRATQLVRPDPDFAFLYEEVEGLGVDDAFEHARRRAVEIMEGDYDLATGPLLRVYIAKNGPEDHLVAIGMHHIVSDMWSFTLLAQEIAQSYRAGGVDLEEMPIGYRDYTIWQCGWIEGGALAPQQHYWEERLRDISPLDLATDHPRPAFYSFKGGIVRAVLAPEMRLGIQSLSAKNRATPFMTTLAAFNVLLSTYSGQDDIAIGAPVANRTHSATENLIGSFVNTLVHRNHIAADQTFRELLGEVRATALDAFANQDLPFEMLVKELMRARDPSRPPLVQVLFNVANVHTDGVELPGIKQEVIELDRRTAQFELTLNVALNALQSHLALTYNSALFTRETAERLLDHYLEILRRVIENPDIRISELQQVSPTDRKLLLDDWNETDRPYTLDVNVPQLLATVAAARPGRIAVNSPTGPFTYAELVDYAGRVTAALQALGVKRGDRVAIVMQRSREMLGGLLGILGSGAAYVPVDPNYPAARVGYMLEDSQAAAVVTHRGLERPYAPTAPVLDLDQWQLPEPAPFVATEPDGPAYVIYTSGSTGKPKGVEISHGAMVNFLRAMQECPGFGPDDRILAVTTISFDISVLELFLPLIAGGLVAVTDEDEAIDSRRLIRRIEEEGITVMQATPATWKLMLSGGWRGAPSLRVLCGGEPLPRGLADQLLDRVGELWNMYGPTETTVWSTVERIVRDDSILVGRPIANTTLYVLGEDLELRPIGVSGELYIGGKGVANGYVNRPDMTRDRFIDSPFRPGEILYRTGDVVRYRHDGRVEHLGRADNQVKIRGFRIELGEVETALQSHAAVQDAVAIAADDRLVGYVVFHPGQQATTTELRTWVSNALPPYMVPALFMTLDELPLTPNGKVDRKQLPSPTGQVQVASDVAAPTDPIGQAIAGVWSSLLGIDHIGAEDNFFEIGGHSLLAVEAVALIEERTGHRPEPRSLFFMTLGEIAATISSQTADA